jgi:hypothetical protein
MSVEILEAERRRISKVRICRRSEDTRDTTKDAKETAQLK